MVNILVTEMDKVVGSLKVVVEDEVVGVVVGVVEGVVVKDEEALVCVV